MLHVMPPSARNGMWSTYIGDDDDEQHAPERVFFYHPKIPADFFCRGKKVRNFGKEQDTVSFQNQLRMSNPKENVSLAI